MLIILVKSLEAFVCIFCPERFLVGLCRGMSELYFSEGRPLASWRFPWWPRQHPIWRPSYFICPYMSYSLLAHIYLLMFDECCQNTWSFLTDIQTRSPKVKVNVISRSKHEQMIINQFYSKLFFNIWDIDVH